MSARCFSSLVVDHIDGVINDEICKLSCVTMDGMDNLRTEPCAEM